MSEAIESKTRARARGASDTRIVPTDLDELTRSIEVLDRLRYIEPAVARRVWEFLASRYGFTLGPGFRPPPPPP